MCAKLQIDCRNAEKSEVSLWPFWSFHTTFCLHVKICKYDVSSLNIEADIGLCAQWNFFALSFVCLCQRALKLLWVSKLTNKKRKKLALFGINLDILNIYRKEIYHRCLIFENFCQILLDIWKGELLERLRLENSMFRGIFQETIDVE